MAEKLKLKKYYSWLMLISTVIFIVIIVTFGIIIFTTIYRAEKIKFLENYEDNLDRMVRYYSNKHEEFENLMLIEYIDDSGHIAMEKFLRNKDDSIFYRDPFSIKKIQYTLQSICNEDRDIAAVFIYKSVNQSLYVYESGMNVIKKVDENYPYYKELSLKTPHRANYGTREINLKDYNIKSKNIGYNETVFAIAGTLNIERFTSSKKVDSIMIAYRVKGISDELESKNIGPLGRFVIFSLNGEIIYDNGLSYGLEKNNDLYEELMELEKNEGKIKIDGKTCFVTKHVDEKNAFMAAYYIPSSTVIEKAINTSTFLGMSIVLFSFTALTIYFVSTKLINKRINQLEKGMKQIGLNNLDYRIPIGRKMDEFSLIAEKFNYMCDELQETIESVYLYEIRQKNAEFYSLQTSINPHFLYNTLEAVKVKLNESGNYEAAEMIVMLARLFHFQTKGKSFITIEEELSKTKLYVDFFLLRYDFNFSYKVDIDERILSYGIPQYTIQPILENYFIHGIRETEDNEIIVRGLLGNGEVEISVKDNGRGIKEDKLNELSEKLSKDGISQRDSYGLLNVHERLKIVFGKHFGLSIESDGENKGTIVKIKLKAATVEELESTKKGV
jgi:two-component system, sensor histidine kinase YesM